MRFPSIDFMDPVFKLFTKLNMFDEKLMIEYKLDDVDHTFQHFNGRSYRKGDPVTAADNDIFCGTSHSFE